MLFADGDGDLVIGNNSLVSTVAGLGSELNQVADSEVAGNSFSGVSEAFLVEYGVQLNLTANIVNPGTTYGYVVQYSTGVTLFNASVLGATSDAIFATDDAGLTLDDLNLSGSVVGVYDQTSTNLVIENSNLSGTGTQYGVDNDGGNGLVVSNSNLSHLDYGVYMNPGSGLTIDRTNLDWSASAGFYALGGSNILIENSTARFAATDAIESDSNSNVTIENSNLSGSSAFHAYGGVATTDDFGLSLLNDSIENVDYPVSDSGTNGIRLAGDDLSNETGGNFGASFANDADITVASSTFFADSGFGTTALDVAGLTLSHDAFDDVQGGYGATVNTVIGLVATNDSFSNDAATGLFVTTSTGVVLTGDTATGTPTGIWVEGSSGVTLADDEVHGTTNAAVMLATDIGVALTGNDLSHNGAPGTYGITADAVSGLTVVGNNLSESDTAAFVEASSGVAFVGNEFQSDNASLWFDGTTSALVYHNDFVHALYENFTGGLANAEQWDNGYPSGGNYWSNYTGVDVKSGPGQNLPRADGIGDTPVVLNAANVDRYPLWTPWSQHEVVFIETGLPAATPWGASVNGVSRNTTNNSQTFYSLVGTLTPFTYAVQPVPGYLVSPRAGSGTLGKGAVIVALTFTPVTYHVTFQETGLATGVLWLVSLNPGSNNSIYLNQTGVSSLVFQRANGTYTYLVHPVPGYLLTTGSASGPVVIQDTQPTISFVFTAVTYVVSFSESGLPSGTQWGVDIGGVRVAAPVKEVHIDLANGSYNFTPNSVSGYTVTPPAGSVNVTGGELYLTVVYVSVPPSTGGLLGGNGGASPFLTYVLIAALVVVTALAVYFAIRRRGAAPPAATDGAASTPMSPSPPPAPPGERGA